MSLKVKGLFKFRRSTNDVSFRLTPSRRVASVCKVSKVGPSLVRLAEYSNAMQFQGLDVIRHAGTFSICKLTFVDRDPSISGI